MSALYCNSITKVPDFIEFVLASATPSSQNVALPILWNTTPTSKTGFPLYTTSQWTSGRWTPGQIGLYMIVVNYNMAGGTTPGEFVVAKNTVDTTSPFNTPAMLGTVTLTANNASYEGTMTCLFSATSATDFVNFLFYPNNASGGQYCGSSTISRNMLRIIKLV